MGYILRFLGEMASLTTIIFTVLKLTDKVDWGWFWVLSPIIFVIALDILVGVPYRMWKHNNSWKRNVYR